MDCPEIRVPPHYDPDTAARIDTGGCWVPPLAAGLSERGDTISLVVLHPRSFEPAYIRELPCANGLEQVHGCLAEAAGTVANFNLLLCCALDPVVPRPTEMETLRRGPWLWVRYPPTATLGAYGKTEYLTQAWDKPYYFALALATQLQEDFNLLQEFNDEFRHLAILTQAMGRLKQILLSRFPDDMGRVAHLCHDLSF